MGGAYDTELQEAWLKYKRSGDTEKAKALDQYRELAKRSQVNAHATQATMNAAPPDKVGRTYTVYPELPPTEGLPAQYPKIPLAFGAQADPYAGQYPGPNPTAKAFVRPGTPASTMRHEQVHVDTNTVARPMDRNAAWYNALSPAERVEFRAVKALHNAADSHARFADMPGGESMEPDFAKRLADERQEQEVVLAEIDKRTKALGRMLPEYEGARAYAQRIIDLNTRTLADLEPKKNARKR